MEGHSLVLSFIVALAILTNEVKATCSLTNTCKVPGSTSGGDYCNAMRTYIDCFQGYIDGLSDCDVDSATIKTTKTTLETAKGQLDAHCGAISVTASIGIIMVISLASFFYNSWN